VFLGGLDNHKAIMTLDWNTLEYTMHDEELTNSHQYGTCALIKTIEGDPMVAIASGRSDGMEIWNPATGDVINVSPNFPGMTGDVESPKMIPVKGGSELIYYETGSSELARPILKYFVANNSWVNIGEMMFGRDDFSVIPVRDIACP